MLQSYALCLEVGLWSGNKRKMEISESHAQPMVTVSDGGRYSWYTSSTDIALRCFVGRAGFENLLPLPWLPLAMTLPKSWKSSGERG